jgi:surface polysaccharide O-acyltransferase-like enzyme
MSPLLFGIYLAHHLVSHRLLVKVPFIEHSQLLFVVDFALTTLLVRGLKFTPLKRFI